MFALAFAQNECGMPEALRFIGENLEGTHHRGSDDSRNIAKIYAFMLKKMRG